ncbi:hypothetical protein [Tenacibaculum sp. Ill]|uniref:hypothetical protein n=1 Tax=Tenacibaculum sp. Ill TaxID=3445935 RepID=UPI003F7AAC6C
MEREKQLKKPYRNLMIKFLIITLFFISCKKGNKTDVVNYSLDKNEEVIKRKSVKKQKHEFQQEYDIVELGYFDNDNVKDTIKCFYKNDVKTGEPLCDCKVILKSEIKEISIPMFSGSMQINNFEKGQVETYEVNRNGDYEETISYQFNDKFGDWFIKSITITENGEETTSKPKEIWNISRTVKK